jgi:glycosyltransferase 2 family protein
VTHYYHVVQHFFEQLAAVGWVSLGIACGLLVLRLLFRVWGWRTILAAAFPGRRRVRWSSVTGAYLAGVGVNSILPARAGDALRAYLIKHRIEDSTYPTIAATLVVETLFDTFVGAVLLGWAIASGELPGLDVLPHLPSIDWGWPLRHPRLGGAIAAVILVGVIAAGFYGARKVREFRQRVAQGFAVLGRPRGRYFRGVVFPQALSWVCRLASIYFFLEAFHVHATLRNAFLVQVVLSLSTVIPFTPGGAGTQQGLLVYVFRGQRGLILSFSVGMNIATVLVNVVLGFTAIALMLRTFRFRRVLARAKEDEQAVEPAEAG